ncbi:unnamed protein product, partial [Iphiclides podalirius]
MITASEVQAHRVKESWEGGQTQFENSSSLPRLQRTGRTDLDHTQSVLQARSQAGPVWVPHDFNVGINPLTHLTA